MNNQFKFQAEDMMKAAKEARIPENVQHMAEETVAKTQEAYLKMAAVAKDNSKVAEKVITAAQENVKELGEKVFENFNVNTQATLDAAQAIARAKTLPEAAKLQADFFQQQFAIAGAQTKELFELTTKLSQETFQSMNDAATKSFEQIKKRA